MMKNLLMYSLIFCCMLISSSAFSQGISRFNVSSGNWSDVNSWNNSGPSSTTDVRIESGNNCTLDTTVTCNDLRLEFGCTLTINAGKELTVDGVFDVEDDAVVNNSGKMILNGDIQSNGSTIITLGGSVEINGSLEISSGFGAQ